MYQATCITWSLLCACVCCVEGAAAIRAASKKAEQAASAEKSPPPSVTPSTSKPGTTLLAELRLFSVLTAKNKLISRVTYNCVTFCPLHFCCWFILYLTMLITVYIDFWYHCTAIVLIIPSVLWHCWSGIRKSVRPVKNGVMRCWCGHLSGVHIVCIWSSWCHCHPETLSSLVCLNPDWFYLSGTS